ncbi:MAG: DUF262 domain-containing protein [Bacteroidales bacterium]|jgi:hypothetical protein|nr:DUF262 domain-containing protein [Bacteroidales bacterium]
MATTKITDLFNDRCFEIPRYQRGYAWERQHVRELFDDIKEAIDSNSSHYIGTVVLSKCASDPKKYYVVDGQQRLTTITLIIAQLLQKIQDGDIKIYQKMHYIKKGSQYSLKPLQSDVLFFQKLLDGDMSVIPQNKSQRYMIEAVEEMKYQIGLINNPEQFIEAIGNLEIMEFIENSEGDAIRIFQTVNDRGKSLSYMEKIKSLLVYFSNKYLDKKYDDSINEVFSDIFELYDSIKYNGGDMIGINLIKRQNFSEDNILSYHYVTYSSDNYEPPAEYVFKTIKQKLTDLRRTSNFKVEMANFINQYIASLKSFFVNLNSIILKVGTETKYYKLFVILNLSATLYPLIVKLQEKGVLENDLIGSKFMGKKFFDLVELIDVRVYKTRGTDPKADIVRFVSSINDRTEDEIQDWLLWFNTNWMSKEQFNASLSVNIYGNRALPYIFVDYCESIRGKDYSMTELQKIVKTIPTIEHVLSQTPDFKPESLGFKDMEDFVSYEHRLGNLSLLEKSLNSTVQKKVPLLKVTLGYDKSFFEMTKKLASNITSKQTFAKQDVIDRTEDLKEYCEKRWWADVPESQPVEMIYSETEDVIS